MSKCAVSLQRRSRLLGRSPRTACKNGLDYQTWRPGVGRLRGAGLLQSLLRAGVHRRRGAPGQSSRHLTMVVVSVLTISCFIVLPFWCFTNLPLCLFDVLSVFVLPCWNCGRFKTACCVLGGRAKLGIFDLARARFAVSYVRACTYAVKPD